MCSTPSLKGNMGTVSRFELSMVSGAEPDLMPAFLTLRHMGFVISLWVRLRMGGPFPRSLRQPSSSSHETLIVGSGVNLGPRTPGKAFLGVLGFSPGAPRNTLGEPTMLLQPSSSRSHSSWPMSLEGEDTCSKLSCSGIPLRASGLSMPRSEQEEVLLMKRCLGLALDWFILSAQAE